MERRVWIVVRVALAAALLVLTAVTAFVAGFQTATLVEARIERPGQEAPGLPPPTPAPLVAPPISERPEQETFRLFWEVWDILQRDYYGELPDAQTVAYGAIRGLLSTLGDEYTSFIEPQIAAILNEDASGSFEGIGAFVRMREDGKLEITGIIHGSPAEEAGLNGGDRVLAVNGQSIIGYGIYEAIALIRGPAGSPVTLLIERPGREDAFEIALTRARIEIPLVEAEMLEYDVAYVRLTEFSAPATRQMEEALSRLLAQDPVGLVLDLRDNPGGWLDQAVDVADLFLGQGLVLIERSADGSERVYRSQDGGLAERIPLVVLINQGSASASEIVAGAIQARGRGVLVGEQTFGKGSVQRPYRLSDGSELRVTVARWFTPADVAIHGQGLSPDVPSPLPESLEPGQDPQLDTGLAYLLGTAVAALPLTPPPAATAAAPTPSATAPMAKPVTPTVSPTPGQVTPTAEPASGLLLPSSGRSPGFPTLLVAVLLIASGLICCLVGQGLLLRSRRS